MTSLDDNDIELYDTIEFEKVHACVIGFTLGASIAIFLMLARFIAPHINGGSEL
jgi:ATP-dependent protease ClpP protease subunit